MYKRTNNHRRLVAARPVGAYLHEVGVRTARRIDVDGGQSGGPVATNRSEPACHRSGARWSYSGGARRARRTERSRSPVRRLELVPNQQPGIAAPPIPNPPMAPGARAPANQVPRVIPIEPLPATSAMPPPEPRVIVFPIDGTGMVPERPPVPETTRTDQEVAGDVSNLIESVHIPESEISVAEGQTKVIQTRRDLTRIVISNPLVADVELLTDQPSSRLLNLYGKSFGTTTLTMWDQTNRPVSFLVRVSLDTADLTSRIRQGFPGAEVKVRQAGPQIILDGQVPDSKTMADIVQLVTLHADEQPVVSDGAAEWRWPAAVAAAAARRRAGRFACGNDHQSDHGPRPASGLATRQDCRNQPEQPLAMSG